MTFLLVILIVGFAGAIAWAVGEHETRKKYEAILETNGFIVEGDVELIGVPTTDRYATEL